MDVWVPHTCLVPERGLEEGVKSPETGVTDYCEPLPRSPVTFLSSMLACLSAVPCSGLIQAAYFGCVMDEASLSLPDNIISQQICLVLPSNLLGLPGHELSSFVFILFWKHPAIPLLFRKVFLKNL